MMLFFNIRCENIGHPKIAAAMTDWQDNGLHDDYTRRRHFTRPRHIVRNLRFAEMNGRAMESRSVGKVIAIPLHLFQKRELND